MNCNNLRFDSLFLNLKNSTKIYEKYGHNLWPCENISENISVCDMLKALTNRRLDCFHPYTDDLPHCTQITKCLCKIAKTSLNHVISSQTQQKSVAIAKHRAL